MHGNLTEQSPGPARVWRVERIEETDAMMVGKTSFDARIGLREEEDHTTRVYRSQAEHDVVRFPLSQSNTFSS